MKSFIQFFIDNFKFTFILTAFLFIYGVMGLMRMNSESFPAVSFATAIVQTFYPGASPDTIEEQITKPIEDEIRTVKGLKDVRSVSQSGKSKIIVRADMDNEDVEMVMDDLQKAVQRVSKLPSDLRERPKFEELNSEEMPAVELAIMGSNENRKRDAFADFMKDQLEDNKMVRNVRLVGFRKREYSVELLADKLEQLHVSIDDVLQALQARNQNVPAGNIRSNDQQMLITLDGKVGNVEDLNNVFIRSNFSGNKIMLKDVANVVDGSVEEEVLTRLDGNEATLLVVTKKGGEDTLELVSELETVIENTVVPEGLTLQVYSNEAQKVKNRMDVLRSNAVVGLLMVLIFLLIFLPGEIGVLASLSLPIAIMGTLGFMSVFGMNLDAITVLALVIALGMLVDNSVVISENYTRLVDEGMDKKAAASKAAQQFWLPITCTALTTMAAFLPMLVTKGVMGEFIKYIPVIVCISLTLSLVESFFLLPSRLIFSDQPIVKALAWVLYFPIWLVLFIFKMIFKLLSFLIRLLLGKTEGFTWFGKSKDWFLGVSAVFEKLMRVLVRLRYLVLFAFAGIVGFSGFMLGVKNKFILFPAEQTEVYIARMEAKTGTPVKIMNAYTKIVSDKVKDVLKGDVDSIVARAGVSQADFNDSKGREGNNVGMLSIYMTREASFKLDYIDVLKRLRAIDVPELTDLSFEVVVNGPPVGNPLEATFRSNSPSQLQAVTNEIVEYLKGIDGVIKPQTDDVIGDQEVKVLLDYEKVARLGLNLQLVGQSIKTALEGSLVTELTQDNKQFDLKVKFSGEDKRNINNLKTLLIKDRRGNLIPLGSLAQFEIVRGRAEAKRFDFQKSRNVIADIDPETITSIDANKYVKDYFEKMKDQYPQVSIVFGGEQESTNESFESLGDAMVLALIGIFGILVFLFSSYLRPLIIMSTIPLGLLGFAVAFYFHGRPVSFLAMIGVIGLAGIIVNSGIVLVSFIDELRKDGYALEDALVKASGMRLRAVIVTSLTTISGLFPTAYGIGGRDLLLIPMTLAMAWGLTSGTLLTLIWVPCAYGILEDWVWLMKQARLKMIKPFTNAVTDMFYEIFPLNR